MMTSPDQGLSITARTLLSLPEAILLEVLEYVDTDGLCALAQTCRVLFHLAGTKLDLGVLKPVHLFPDVVTSYVVQEAQSCGSSVHTIAI